MSVSKPLPAEFIALTEKHLAGDITPDELRRWEAMCLADSDALDYYIALIRVESLTPAALERLEARRNAAKRRPGFPLRFVRNPVFLATAACLALAGIVTFKLVSRPEATRVAGVPARVTNAYGLRWVSGGAQPGDRQSAATAAFSSGLLELTMDSGVRLLIQGPASYTVTGPNSLRLDSGRAVADVPLPARGFTLTSPRDHIVDHGTRFAVEVKSDGSETTLGVLSGEVELAKSGGNVHLYTGYAVRRRGDEVLTVPFDKSRFVTEAPTREFPWSITGDAPDTPHRFEYDVTGLVHGPGDYRAVVKFMLGTDTIRVNSVRLECDGVTVVAADGGKSGSNALRTRDNAPVLHVSDRDYRPGRWTLVMDGCCEAKSLKKIRPVNSEGVVSFEEGLSVTADASRFVGRWRYSHDDKDYEREFFPDGTARLVINDYKSHNMDGARWSVKDGVLSLEFPDPINFPTELHMLRDDHTLVFLNRNYLNAVRAP